MGSPAKLDFMNDGNAMFHGHLLQGIRDGCTDEIGMLGGATNDNAKGDHRIRCAATQHQLGANRNLERARDTIDIQGGIRSDDLNLFLNGIEQALDELIVIQRGDDGDADRLLGGTGTAGGVIGHWKGNDELRMTNDKWRRSRWVWWLFGSFGLGIGSCLRHSAFQSRCPIFFFLVSR
jgi:hypothetical protein